MGFFFYSQVFPSQGGLHTALWASFSSTHDTLFSCVKVSTIGFFYGAVCTILFLLFFRATVLKLLGWVSATDLGRGPHPIRSSREDCCEVPLHQAFALLRHLESDHKRKPDGNSSLPMKNLSRRLCDSGRAQDTDSPEESSLDSSTTTSWTDQQEKEETYTRMEELELKMAFVVHHRSRKAPTRDLAALIATTALGLIHELVGDTEAVTRDGGWPKNDWLLWYKWWNRLGSAKIVLKCPEGDALDRVLLVTSSQDLPFYIVRHTAHRQQHTSWRVYSTNRKTVVADRLDEGFSCSLNTTNEKTKIHQSDEDIVVVAIGPAPSARINFFTYHLKLY